MTEERSDNSSGSEVPRATPALKKSTRGRISMIWMIPIIAVLIGIGLVAQTYLEKGPTVEIEFADANGLKAGATPIKFLSVEVGLITEVRLNHERNGVVAIAELEPIARPFLKEGTVFWLVRPQITFAGISAIETLLSGTYIEVVPSQSENRIDRFVGRLNPPIGARYPNARTVILETQQLGSITQGTPLYFQNLRAGEVEHYELSEETGLIRIYAVIDQDFASRVRKSSLFWNASGIAAHVGLDGLDIRTEGLAAMLGGGIAFSAGDEDSAEAQGDSTFTLYSGADSAKHAQTRQRSLELRLETRDGRSLQEGSPIYYRGQEIGSVGESWLTADSQAVRFQVFIDPIFKSLVREGSRFFKVSGIEVSAGLGGVDVTTATLASLAVGGVSLVTPDPPGEPAVPGALFPLYDSAEQGWLAWQPVIELNIERHGEFSGHRLPPKPGDGALELVLQAKEIGAVTNNSAITYRNLVVGSVDGYVLAKDGQSVEIRVRIDRPYRHLVGPTTRFWKSSGLSLDLGLDGLMVEVGSLRTIALGGIEFDTRTTENAGSPFASSKPLRRSDSFELFADEANAWLDEYAGRYATFFVEASESTLSEGAPVYFRRHQIGEVGDSTLTVDAQAVRIELKIERIYDPLVRENSHFWSPGAVSVRGGLSGVDLEVAPLRALLAGGVMLATPTDVRPQANEGFVFQLEVKAPKNWKQWHPNITLASGVPASHLVRARDDLDLVISTNEVDSLGEGDPIFFRGMQIGVVGESRLGPDASEVLVEMEIYAQFSYLVRANTEFWNISGISLDLGWSGFELDTGPLTTLLRGGIQVATPNPPGNPAKSGDRFELRDAPDDEWQDWSPELRQSERSGFQEYDSQGAS